MEVLALLLVLGGGLIEADIEAAHRMCLDRFTTCKSLECDSIAEVTPYTRCRVKCRQEYQSCLEEVSQLRDQG